MNKEMVLAFKFGQTDLSMKENGLKTNLVAKGN